MTIGLGVGSTRGGAPRRREPRFLSQRSFRCTEGRAEVKPTTCDCGESLAGVVYSRPHVGENGAGERHAECPCYGAIGALGSRRFWSEGVSGIGSSYLRTPWGRPLTPALSQWERGRNGVILCAGTAQFLSLAHPFIPPLRNSEPGEGVDTMRAPTIPVRNLTRTLPKPIGAVLGRLDRHVGRASLLRGLGTTAAVVSVVMAMGMTADFLWALPQAIRWASWGAGGCWRYDRIRGDRGR